MDWEWFRENLLSLEGWRGCSFDLFLLFAWDVEGGRKFGDFAALETDSGSRQSLFLPAAYCKVGQSDFGAEMVIYAGNYMFWADCGNKGSLGASADKVRYLGI